MYKIIISMALWLSIWMFAKFMLTDEYKYVILSAVFLSIGVAFI